MNDWLSNPSFRIYAITSLVLCLNLLFLWGYSGATRTKTKSSPNEEDIAKFGGALNEIDPPPVARVLRAHRNAQASIYPFLFLGLVFVLAGGGYVTATILFGTFTAARLLHSVVYLKGKQPWRTLCFVVGMFATFALIVDIGWLLIRAA